MRPLNLAIMVAVAACALLAALAVNAWGQPAMPAGQYTPGQSAMSAGQMMPAGQSTTATDPNAYLWGQINRAKDPSNLTSLEQAHVPAIMVNGPVKSGVPVQVTVRVGEGHMHPSTHDHFIQWIALYDKDIQLGRVDLSPATTQSQVTFTVVLDNSTTLRALENCNLHGTWENTAAVNVS